MQITIETRHTGGHRNSSWHLKCNGDNRMQIKTENYGVTISGLRKCFIQGTPAELKCLGHAILYSAALQVDEPVDIPF